MTDRDAFTMTLPAHIADPGRVLDEFDAALFPERAERDQVWPLEIADVMTVGLMAGLRVSYAETWAAIRTLVPDHRSIGRTVTVTPAETARLWPAFVAMDRLDETARKRARAGVSWGEWANGIHERHAKHTAAWLDLIDRTDGLDRGDAKRLERLIRAARLPRPEGTPEGGRYAWATAEQERRVVRVIRGEDREPKAPSTADLAVDWFGALPCKINRRERLGD